MPPLPQMTLPTPLVSSSGPKMPENVFQLLREFIYQKTGIYFQDNKKYLLEGRLGKRLQVLGISDFGKYFDFLRFNTGRNEEMRYFYDAVTINETFFFRNDAQFEALEKTLVPEILKRKSPSGRTKLRIWSSASSSGEEAHTLGMIYLEKLKPKYPGLEIEIVGTDINNSVVETARQGIYREYSVRSMPKLYLEKYFTVDNLRYTVNDQVRRLVRFENMNLYEHTKMRLMNNFDIIFCCNVLIYFDQKSKIQVVSDLYDGLNSGGFLFIGYAETLHGISSAFKLINFPKTVAYKKE